MYNFAITILAFGLTLSNSAILAQTTSSDIRKNKPWVPQKLTPVPPTEEIFTMGGISAKDNPPVPVIAQRFLIAPAHFVVSIPGS